MEIPIRYKQNNRAKYLRIKLLPDKTIEVVIPPYTDIKEAERFLNEHIESIRAKVKEMPDLLFDFGTYYTKSFKIQIKQNTVSKNSIQTNNRIVIIKIDANKDIQDEYNQSFIKHTLTEVLRHEAQNYLPKRTFELAQKNNLKYRNVKINTAKKRWGSCSTVNNLNFSCFLMMLPTELIDYIILHELSHTIHKNHSPAFYALLNQLSGGQHPILNEKLKAFSIVLNPDLFKKTI